LPFASFLAHVALGAVTALGWLGLGSVLLARTRPTGDTWLDTLNRIGVGALGFTLLTFFAGLAGLLYPALYVPLLVGSALGGVARLPGVARAVPRPQPRSWPPWQLALAALLGVTVLLVVVATCAPLTTRDSLHYHASAPARYVESHELLEIPWSWSSYQPFTVEMLIADGMLLRDSVQGALAPLLLALAGLAAAIGMGARVGGRGLALLAGAIFFVQPLMAFEASGTLIETGLGFATALAAWNLAVFVRRGETASLALCGLFAGAAAAMKYVGLFVPLVVGAALFLVARRRLTPAALAAFAVPAVAVALPWYVKNAVQTGNPLYPFVFGGLSEEAQDWIDTGIHEHGHGRGPLDALLLPFRLLASGDDFENGSWLSPLPLLFAPLCLLDARRRRWCVPALAAVLAFLAAWFLTSQQARFLLPLAPVVAVLAGIGILALAARGRVGRLAAPLVTAAALAAGLAMAATYTAQFVPIALGFQDRDEFLEAKTPYYDGVRWLNRELGDHDTVLLDFSAVLYMQDPYVVWTPVVLPTPAPADETRRFARENRLTHAAILEVNLEARRPQLVELGAREIGVVPVQAPVFGLRITRGQPERLHVYELAGCCS
jgi:hypothetical protein